MSQYLDPSQLRPGDVLLMKGIGAVSDLIAWLGDSIYSHAAILVDASTLVEAALPTSRSVPLAERLAQGDHYDFLDVYRPTRPDGRPLEEVDRAALASSAQSLLGLGYPLDALLELAVISAIRNKVPADWRLRFLLRILVDHLLKEDPTQAVCSELVYRCFLSASRSTHSSLTPLLVPSGALDLPFPPIRWAELVEEWEEARKRRPSFPALPIAASAGAAAPPAGPEAEDLEEKLCELLSRRANLIAEAMEPAAAPAALPVVLQPNPRDVLPVDLETSPNLRRLGRLQLTKPLA